MCVWQGLRKKKNRAYLPVAVCFTKKMREIYFQENPDRESDKYQEIQKYLKLRIRSVMELLIENEDTERMEQIEKCGWFSANELENFIRCAQEKAKLRSLVWLLHLKDKKYGYQKKDFSL